MLRHNLFTLAERRIITSGASRRDGASSVGKMVVPHPQRSHPVATGRPRVMGHSNGPSRAGTAATAAAAAPRHARTQFVDPMDEILPVQDGLDADFPNELAGTSARLERRPARRLQRQQEDDLEADHDDDGEEDMMASGVARGGAEAGRSNEVDDEEDFEEEVDAAEDEAEDTEAMQEVEGEEDDHDDAAADHDEAADADTANMEEAYRFLLHHIDAEMAAIQRRQEDVKTRRQQKEAHYQHTVKELFEMMESPWLLIPDPLGMPLPATGMDVYVKEELMKRNTKSDSTTSSASGHRAAKETQNKMLHLALEKNYRSFPAARKQPYVEAARHNDLRRHELKSRLHKGCSKFEAYLEHVKECTADMVRRGEVSDELPSHGLAQSHAHASRPRRGTSVVHDDAKDAPASGSSDGTQPPAKGPGRGRKRTASHDAPAAAAASASPAAASAVTSTRRGRPGARKQVKGSAKSHATAAKTNKKPSTGRAGAKKVSGGAKTASPSAASHPRGGKGRGGAAKKPPPAAAKRGAARGGARTASIPLPSIPGLRLKLKADKAKAQTKASPKKAAATRAKPKNKKKK